MCIVRAALSVERTAKLATALVLASGVCTARWLARRRVVFNRLRADIVVDYRGRGRHLRVRARPSRCSHTIIARISAMHRTALAFTRSTLFRSTKLRTVSHAASRFHSSALQRKSDDAAESDLTHPALLKDPPTSNPSSATDPWTLKPPPLPETPLPTNEQGQVVQSMEELLASPHPEGRDNEDAETLRKRLLYESRKRGILEMDLILGTFAKTRLEGMSERELREYDRVSPPACSVFLTR